MFPRQLARVCAIIGALLIARSAAAQTTATWANATNGLWFTSSNWSSLAVPNNLSLHRAAISATGSAYTVTASGSTSIGLLGLDVSSSNAQVLFDFSSTSFGLTLGSSTSTWSAGAVEFRTTAGLAGNGSANTTLTIASGAQLSFSTMTGTRGLSSMTLANSGTLQVTSGVLSVGSAVINNQSSGLIHANGAEVAFQNGVTLTNNGILRATGSTGILRFNNTMTTAGLGTVDLVSGGRAILSGTLNNASATLGLPGAGTYELTGGTINGGTVATGGLKLTGSAGTLNGVTLSGDFTSPNNTGVYFTGGTTFTGANGSLGNNTYLYWQQASTIAGKTMTFGSGAYIYVNGVNNTLTLDSASSASGQLQIYSDGSSGTAITNQGSITHTGNYGYLYAKTFTNSGNITTTNGNLQIGSASSGYNTSNSGTITANGSSAVVYLDGNVANTGTVGAQNSGQLWFRGNNTTANLGTVQIATGGHVYLNGTLDNTSATLNVPTGGSFELLGGTVKGGTIAASALSLTNYGGTIDGATLTGDFNSAANSSVNVKNGATFTGANASLGNNTYLYWQQAGTLSGKAMTFGSGAYIYVNGANNTLTLGSGTTATGQVQIYSDGSNGTTITNQGTITHNSSYGYLYAISLVNSGNITTTNGNLQIGSTSSGYNTTNSGTILANGSSAIVYLDGNVANTGTMGVKNSGQLIFRGNNTTANLGAVQIATGGHVYLNGTLDNTSATLNVPTGGSFELLGGSIKGGTIAAGALSLTNYGGGIDGATLIGDFNSAANSGVSVKGGTTFTGANASLGNNSFMTWQQTGTLTGKAITFGSGASIYISNSNNALTLGAGTTATGQVQIYSDGSSGSAITNQGTITHNSSYGYLYAPTLANSGNITATSGTLQIGSTSSGYNTNNSGTITANGSSAVVNLDGNVTNTGTLAAQNSGQLIFRGNNTTANLGAVTIASGGHAYLNGTIDNTSSTLPTPTGGSFELLGGTITGGTIPVAALTFTNYSGYLSGSTLAGDLTLGASTGVYFKNSASFSGTNASLGASSYLYWQQSGTLSGKALTFGNGSYLYVNGTNNTLTLGATSTATGQVQIYSDGSNGSTITNQGSITHTGSYGYLYAPIFTNSGSILATGGTLNLGYYYNSYNLTNTSTGTITADGASTTIVVNGALSNTGTLRAQNSGTLIFSGSNQTADFGTVQLATGGRALLNGTLNNTSATLNAPSGGSYQLYGGTINNGTVASGALSFTSSGGTLSAVSLLGDLTLAGSAYVYFNGGTTFSGTNATLGGYAGLYWKQTGALSGKSLSFADGSFLYITAANSALTLDNTSSATGDIQIYTDSSTGTAFTNSGTITHNSSYGYIYGNSVTNLGSITATAGTLNLGYYYGGQNFTNGTSGTVTVDGGSATIDLNGAFTNNGTLRAQNFGRLIFTGTIPTTNFGTVQIATSGHVLLNGTFDNSSATLAAPSGGNYELYGGTINNGSVATGALSFTGSGGTLNNVTLLGDLSLPASSNVVLTGGSTFNGANASLGSSATLYWQQAGTLTGKNVTLGSGAYFYLNTTGASLTLDPTSSMTGDVEIFGSTGNTTFTNQGAITHTSGYGYIYANTVTNSGNITVSGGTLQLGTASTGYTFTNGTSGTLNVTNSSAAIQLSALSTNPVVNQGAINVQSGTFYTSSLTNSSTGTITGAGTLYGNLTFAGGLLAPGNNGVGTLTLANGNFFVTGSGVLAIDISGSASDKFVFQNPGSLVNIGSGLLTLSVNLLSSPTPNTTYTFLNISTTGSTLTGTFAGLPTSGGIVTTSYFGTPVNFTINYLPTSVSLSYNGVVVVPEPETYALFGCGVALLAFARWRSRRRNFAVRPIR
jgi:hypothetical protein